MESPEDYGKSMHDILSAIDNDPFDPEWHHYLSDLLVMAGDYDLARMVRMSGALFTEPELDVLYGNEQGTRGNAGCDGRFTDPEYEYDSCGYGDGGAGTMKWQGGCGDGWRYSARGNGGNYSGYGGDGCFGSGEGFWNPPGREDYKISEGLTVKNGLYILVMRGGWSPFVLIGWVVRNDMFFEVYGARVIKKFGEHAHLSHLAAYGPIDDTEFLAKSKVEYVPVMSVSRAIPADRFSWSGIVSEPENWSELNPE